MEMKRLDLAETFRDAFSIGLKNAPSVIAALLLWLVTIWIPYLNVGTTIAMSLLPIELAKGGVINPLGIFDSKYRRYMGEFFITAVLKGLGTVIGLLFLYIPGIVLSLAWSLAFYFLIEKGKNPIEAIKASNDATYGNKWNIFGMTLLLVLIFYVVCLAFVGIGILCQNSALMLLMIILAVVAVLIFVSISMAFRASIWKQLKVNVQ